MSTPQILGVITHYGLVDAGGGLSWAYADRAHTLRVSIQPPDGTIATRPISAPVGAYELLQVSGNACTVSPSGLVFAFALLAADKLPV